MAVPPPPCPARPPADEPMRPPVDKSALRRHLRAARTAFVSALDAPALAGAQAAIDSRLTRLLAEPGVIAGYVAHRGEPDILPFLIRAHDLGRAIALPHVQGDGRMHFAPWHPDFTLAPGIAGIAQPEAASHAIAPAILLVPLIGFDRAGHRIGQGGGYYDRWFAAHPQSMRIGIAWSVQEVEAIPCESWDMPLHAIVTEKEWICP